VYAANPKLPMEQPLEKHQTPSLTIWKSLNKVKIEIKSQFQDSGSYCAKTVENFRIGS
jgi:hypothetical protein